jgi:hypothetical protein
MPRVSTPTRTRAPGTGAPPLSTTVPRTVAPAGRVMTTPSRGVTPSSVMISLVPGACAGWRPTRRKLPAASASKRNRPSASVVAASRRSSAWVLQSDAP